MTIKLKLISASFIVFILFCATLTIAWWGGQQAFEQKQHQKKIAQARFSLEKLDSAIAEALLLQGISLSIDAVVSAQASYQQSLETLVNSKNASKVFLDDFHKLESVVEDYFGDIEDLLSLDMVASDNEEALVILFDLQELRAEQRRFFGDALSSAEADEIDQSNYTKLMMVITISCIMLGLVFLFWHLYRVVVPPMSGLSNALAELELTGNFSVTAKYWNRDEIGKSVHAFNHTMKAVKTAVDEVNQVMSDLAEENYSSRVKADMRGDLDRLKRGTNLMAEALQQQVIELQEAMLSERRAGQFKSQFLANMSHEIRTPMNGVLGMIDLLTKTKLNEQQQHFASTAMSSAKSLLSLINDILDFSKIEAGYLEIEQINFNVRKLIEETVSSFALATSEKDVELLADLKDVDVEFVIGDPSRIRQILTNLLSNAVKFTDQGEIALSCRVSHEAEGVFFLHCEVSDTGIGIPKDKTATLFDSFTQVDASTTRKYGGTGLGLAISKKLCELMEGEILVESEEGEGTRFAFYVKLQKGKKLDLTLPNSDEVSGKLVMIVDDNQTNLDVLRGYLEHWGARVIEAMSAKHAHEILGQASALPDVLVIDMQMPEEDGASLGKALSQDERYKGIPKIMMTSISQYRESEFFKNHGFSAYIPKPVVSSDLAKALALVLSKQDNADDSGILTQAKLAQFNEDTGRSTKANILLVEDNRVNQLVAEAMISPLGYHVEIVENGKVALDKLANSDMRFDIIFMDCQMPEMDGYEATEKIRSDTLFDAYKQIPIIAMTANALKGDREKCFEAGMDDYLSKPIESEILQEKLLKWQSRMS